MITPALCLLAATSSTVTLTLDEAVQRALHQAPAVTSAGHASDRAALAAFRAQLDRVSVTVDAQVQEIWTRTGLGGAPEAAFEGGLGLSNLSARLEVPVFSGFGVESRAARAEHLEAAAGHDLAAARREVGLAAARAFLAARQVALLEAVTARAVRRLEEAEGVTLARVEAGLAPPVDHGRAVARRRLQQVRLRDLAGQRAEAEARLLVLLGLEGPVELAGGPQDGLHDDLEALLDEALRARPELAAARARRLAQDEAIDVAFSAYYPQLGVYGLFQLGNNPFVAGAGNRAVPSSANPFAGMTGDVQLGVSVKWNIFDTLNTFTDVKAARIEAARLEAELERVRQQVEAEVRAAYTKQARLRSVLVEIDAVIESVKDNLRITRRRYEDGEALVFELLEAELELSDVERQRTGASVDLMTARAELAAAVGRAWGAPREESR